MNNLLETKNLEFNKMISYKDMTILKHQVTFITGESGCGKSTLLKLFNATLSPSHGNIFYNRKNLETLDSIALRQEVSLVSQEVFLFDASIKDNFLKFYEFRGCNPPPDKQIEKFLSLCCLDFPLEKDTIPMSGGERQRLYLAIFLSFLPKVLLLDEPTSALDSQTSRFLMEGLLPFCKENRITLLVVSHDKEITERFSQHTILLKRQVV